jgi:type III secretion system FlhB-like substrate exporter
VPHHDLRLMSPARQQRPSTESAANKSPSPNKTYAKSVMFQSYASNTSPVRGAQLENSKYGSTSAARIPLPEFVVVQYDQYPAPPVYIDGKGHVLEDVIKRRPVTAPVQTQEELHRLQMSNHFKRQSQQEQYNQMLALKYKAATIGAPGGTPSGSGITEKTYPSMGVTSGVHYEHVEPRPLTHSKGRVVVKKNKKKQALLRPRSPNMSAAPNGTLSLGYAPKPRTGTVPMSGILRDGTPDDWKTALFAGNDVRDTGRKGSAHPQGVAPMARKEHTPL